jgi:homogentisate 1,2-dioxygenase
MAFMFESRYTSARREFAVECPQLQSDYYTVWQGLRKYFKVDK